MVRCRKHSDFYFFYFFIFSGCRMGSMGDQGGRVSSRLALLLPALGVAGKAPLCRGWSWSFLGGIPRVLVHVEWESWGGRGGSVYRGWP